MPKVSCVPDDEKIELTPLDPVALLGTAVKTKSLRFSGARSIVLLVWATAEAARTTSPLRLGRRRISFMCI